VILLDTNIPLYAVDSSSPHHQAVRGAAVSDAHLAALAIEYGAVLASTDRGFHRFRGLRLVSPLD
jgi:predicted nucleic acid-binding protein